MKDGNTNANDRVTRELNVRQAEVLDELLYAGEGNIMSTYCRALESIKERLVMDDEYEPSENLSLVRVLTLLERDLKTLSQCGAETVVDVD